VGATGPTLVVPNAAAAQAGSYTVVVTDIGGSLTSTPATLTLAAANADPGRLTNLSILTPLSSGETMTIGTVLGGAGTVGTKPLLARAAGPALGQLGIANFLPDPTLTLKYTSTVPAVVAATNNDWNGDASLLTAFSALGAFPFASAASRDAALFLPILPAGNYTADVRDLGSGAGTVIAELYDGTPAGAFTVSTPRLINVSVLKSIAGSSSLTAGFVIGGATAKSVLIRAIGPGLAPLGVTGVMPDPQVTLNSTSANPSVVLAANNDWGGSAALVQTAVRIGAFSVSDSASKDAILLTTLAPGNYTAEVGPAAGTPGGTVIVEIYEVP
jgi:hypothetical protein